MDFSAVCLDGMLGVGLNSSSTSSNHNLNQLKHCRSASEMDMEQTTSRDQDWRSTNSTVKMARTESYVPALMRSTSMISDASRLETSNSGASDLLESAEQATRLMRSDSVVSPYNKSGLSLPFYQTSSGAAYQYASGSNKPAGMVPVSLSMGGSGGVHAMFSGARMNPFTTSQWQELEHQALIFKYMMAGVQVPPELLIPIRKNSMNMNMNMNTNMFSSLSGVGSLRPNLGWSSFHLGFANNADPEPGRCRRTDGKKWRCSRDAVPDQKYCERHMNRGRHRSRKPVEGQTQTSHAAAAAAATSHSSSGAALSSSPTSLAAAAARSAVTPPNTTSNTNPSPSLANLRPSIGTQSQQHHHQHQQQQQHIGIKSSAYPPSMDAATTPFQVPLTVDRYLNGMKGDLSGQFFDSSSQSIHGGLFNDGAWRSRMVPQSAKTTNNLMGFESRTLVDDAQDFGLGQMNLLPMAAQRNEQQQRQEQQRPAGAIRHFFDDWPSSRDRSAAVSWSEIEQMRTSAATTAAPASSATQLSISIPSDFSSPASPNNKLTLSPLKLSTSRSDDPLGMDMGLGVGMGLGIETEHRHRQQHQQTNWIPITWESPVGGPLAEVLNSTSTTSHDCNGKNSSSALNLMTGEGWDCSSNSPRGDTSPTGVLQKTLGSLSDSSTGSSPRAVKAPPETALCENLRTATFVTAGAQISTA